MALIALTLSSQTKTNKGWRCHLHLKSISRQKKNYGNSNISPCKKHIPNLHQKKKSSKRKPKSFKILL
jgi:hypothetical protein